MVAASAPGATAAANFTLTNTAGAAAEITCTSGSGQSATVSTAFGAPLVSAGGGQQREPGKRPGCGRDVHGSCANGSERYVRGWSEHGNHKRERRGHLGRGLREWDSRRTLYGDGFSHDCRCGAVVQLQFDKHRVDDRIDRDDQRIWAEHSRQHGVWSAAGGDCDDGRGSDTRRVGYVHGSRANGSERHVCWCE